MWRHLASNALTFLLVVMFLAAGVVAWGSQQYSAPGPLAQGICLQVESGSNMRRVSENLVEQGAISSGALFRMGAEYSDKTRLLKAGSFLIDDGASMEEIVDVVTRGGANTCGTEVVYRVGVRNNSVQVRELDPASGRYSEVAEFTPGEESAPEDYQRVLSQDDTRLRLAIAEGVTSWQIARALEAIDVLDGSIDATPAEGSLAPDSYEFSQGEGRQALLARMAAAQERILAEAWEQRGPDAPVSTPEDALILASLIEKETGVAEERRQVASVFANRLEDGMRLQTDPAVIYGVTNGEGILGRGLRRSELDRPTPYNTYLIDGLPPTPIANPGRASIEAALNPAETDFLYFVADGTGGHAFATNLADHNRNVAAWRVIEAERASDG